MSKKTEAHIRAIMEKLKPTPEQIAIKALGLMQHYFVTCYTDTEDYNDSVHVADVEVESLDDADAIAWVDANRAYFHGCAQVYGFGSAPLVVYVYDHTNGVIGNDIASVFLKP